MPRIQHRRVLAGDVINEITLGCGPAGEARYPAYPEGDRRWRFPGVGEFQCYDAYMLKSLRAAAEASNRPEWGYAGPHDSGTYCSRAEQTGFFHPDCGNWRTEYGNFFLSWYSGLLLKHVNRMVAMGNRVLAEPRRPRTVSFTFTPRKMCSQVHNNKEGSKPTCPQASFGRFVYSLRANIPEQYDWCR